MIVSNTRTYKSEIMTVEKELQITNASECLWANIFIDAGFGQMTINSDVDAYAYNSPETGEDFINLIKSIQPQSLLAKIAKPTEFSFDKTRDNFLSDFETDEERSAVNHIFKEISQSYLVETSVDAFCTIVETLDPKEISAGSSVPTDLTEETITDTVNYMQDNLYDTIAYDYKPWAKKAVEIFREFVQSDIKNKIPMQRFILRFEFPEQQ